MIILVKDPTAPPPLTGEAPLLEQAILALHPDAEVHRLDHLPSRAEDLASADLLILDNPAGLGPESRLAIDEWSKRAGLSLLLLGPRMAEAQLSTNFSPFLDSAPHWESIAPNLELDGANNAGLAKLQAQGRANWSGPSKSGDEVLMKWQDEIPFFMRRINGLGELLILGLPSHQESSELAFRPGFLKILDSAIGRASGNAHERLLLPGQALSQERLRPLSAEQWLGGHFEKLHSPCASSLSSSKTKNTGSLQSTAQPCLGRYFVRGSGVYRLNYEEKQQWLAVARDPEEFLRSPIKLPEAVQNQLGVNRDTGLSLSPYLAFLVLFAIAVDLLLSLGSPWKKAIKAS